MTLLRALFVLPPAAFAVLGASCADSSQGTAPSPSADASAPSDAARSNDTASESATRDAPVDAAPACSLLKPYSTKDNDCNACAERECCEAVNACYAQPDCDDGYVNCLLACVLLPDDAGPDAADAGGTCLAQCAAQHPAGKAAYDALSGCVEARCTVECE